NRRERIERKAAERLELHFQHRMKCLFAFFVFFVVQDCVAESLFSAAFGSVLSQVLRNSRTLSSWSFRYSLHCSSNTLEQIRTHSLQMETPLPAMSFATRL